MVAQGTDNRTPQHKVTKQPSLFGPNLPSTIEVASPETPCDITAMEKRRDGGTRYWRRAHRADATATGGTQASKCRAADAVPIWADEVLELDLNKYQGGVALWGAVPAAYDTTRLKIDRGIHVHARLTPESKKEMDWTYRAVRLVGKGLPDEGAVVTEIDAIYYMVSSVFGFSMSYVPCTHCGWPHLDKDWFSVNPHRRHLCNGCGKLFYDEVIGIGNPIAGIREACGFEEHKVAPAAQTLDIKQSQYPGGLQIWGSNPAFLWTAERPEEEGIHVHAFKQEGQTEPDVDDTFREVTIDGIKLDPVMVRIVMAQNVMPSLKGRIMSMDCPNCGQPGFDAGEAAYVPAAMHTCSECGCQYPTQGAGRGMWSSILSRPFSRSLPNWPRGLRSSISLICFPRRSDRVAPEGPEGSHRLGLRLPHPGLTDAGGAGGAMGTGRPAAQVAARTADGKGSGGGVGETVETVKRSRSLL